MQSTYRERSPHHRSRSPEPYRDARHSRARSHSRSRSPHRSRHHRPRHESDKHERHRRRASPPAAPLPYKAQRLSKSQFDEYKPLFQSYLDIQKRLNLDELDEREVRGRWKSFVSHWNRGELARSWYDPSMLQTAKETIASLQRQSEEPRKRGSPVYEAPQDGSKRDRGESDSDDEFGPPVPTDIASRRTGPTMPKMDDLALRDELSREERARQGWDYRDDIRYERRKERKQEKDRLEELVPRADPGSRERMLEKKRETTSTLKEFRNAKEAGDIEVPESDLMGTDDLDAFKKQKREMERKKTEREIRREEIARARAEEREERLAEIRKKESATMEYLKQIAKERFG